MDGTADKQLDGEADRQLDRNAGQTVEVKRKIGTRVNGNARGQTVMKVQAGRETERNGRLERLADMNGRTIPASFSFSLHVSALTRDMSVNPPHAEGEAGEQLPPSPAGYARPCTEAAV